MTLWIPEITEEDIKKYLTGDPSKDFSDLKAELENDCPALDLLINRLADTNSLIASIRSVGTENQFSDEQIKIIYQANVTSMMCLLNILCKKLGEAAEEI